MLSSVNRLTQKSDFLYVRQNGKFISTPLFSVSWVKNDLSASRFGFIVSKKISMKAHERNRVKRILREVARENLDSVKQGFDFVVVAKVGILHATHGTIETELTNAIKDLQS